MTTWTYLLFCEKIKSKTRVMAPQESKNISGVSYISFPFLNEYNIFCGFTSRDGGYSLGPYSSLNMAYHVGESRELVKKNRELVLREVLGCQADHIFSARQVHGSSILYVGKNIKHRDGDIREDADVLMTDERNMPLMVMGADCTLILAADTVSKAVCAVHAGWKGTLNRIVIPALQEFCSRFHSKTGDINVFLGPCIRQCCYQIDKMLAADFTDRFGEGGYLTAGEDSCYLDLAGINKGLLRGFGIREENIFDTGICTCCSSNYYSYRRQGVTGRQAAIAMLF